MFLGVAVEERLRGRGAPGCLLDDLHDDEGFEQRTREGALVRRQ